MDIRCWEYGYNARNEIIQYPSKSGMLLKADQIPDFVKVFPYILEEIKKREEDNGKNELSFHIGYGIFVTMSVGWKNVSIRRWLTKEKAEFLERNTYTDNDGNIKEKSVISFKGMELMAGGNTFSIIYNLSFNNYL